MPVVTHRNLYNYTLRKSNVASLRYATCCMPMIAHAEALVRVQQRHILHEHGTSAKWLQIISLGTCDGKALHQNDEQETGGRVTAAH